MSRASLVVGVFSLVAWAAGADAAWAEFSPEAVTVKVRSGLCGSDRIRYAGSGSLLRQGERLFVVTSEHVILHGNDRYCHWVSNRAIGRRRAVLRAADWGNGLALLELPGAAAPGFRVPAPRDWDSTSPAGGDRALVTGFRHASDVLIRDARGQVLVAESSQHLLPMIASMIELSGAHGEFGMSGGPVFSAQGRVLGMLSHQYLELVPGGPTQVRELEPGDQVLRNHLLVIPAAAVAAWLETVLSGALPAEAAFVRDPRHQIEGVPAVFSSGLKFELERSFRVGRAAGGGQGVGVGGGQGVGVGGSSGSASEPVECGASIWVSLDDEDRTTRWAFPEKDSWISRVRERLLRRKSVTVSHLVRRDPMSLSFEKVTFCSLPEFFTLMARPELAPIAALLDPGAEEPGLSAADRRALAAGERVVTHSRALLEAVASTEARLLLRQAEALGGVVASGNAELVRGDDVRRIIDPKTTQAAWQQLFEIGFESAVELLAALKELDEFLSRSRL